MSDHHQTPQPWPPQQHTPLQRPNPQTGHTPGQSAPPGRPTGRAAVHRQATPPGHPPVPTGQFHLPPAQQLHVPAGQPPQLPGQWPPAQHRRRGNRLGGILIALLGGLTLLSCAGLSLVGLAGEGAGDGGKGGERKPLVRERDGAARAKVGECINVYTFQASPSATPSEGAPTRELVTATERIPCRPGGYEVLARFPSTVDGTRCGGVPGATQQYVTDDPRSAARDFVLCLKKR